MNYDEFMKESGHRIISAQQKEIPRWIKRRRKTVWLTALHSCLMIWIGYDLCESKTIFSFVSGFVLIVVNLVGLFALSINYRSCCLIIQTGTELILAVKRMEMNISKNE